MSNSARVKIAPACTAFWTGWNKCCDNDCVKLDSGIWRKRKRM